jgi:hypothetical protein
MPARKHRGEHTVLEDNVMVERELIAREGLPELDLNWDELTQLFVHQRAAISHKLNLDDLAEMMLVGVALVWLWTVDGIMPA